MLTFLLKKSATRQNEEFQTFFTHQCDDIFFLCGTISIERMLVKESHKVEVGNAVENAIESYESQSNFEEMLFQTVVRNLYTQ